MRVIHLEEPIADFVGRSVPADLDEAEVWVYRPRRPALVLGSAQPESAADAARAAVAGADVIRRRSGGGAVWVPTDGFLWLDVALPRTDPRWSDDVRESVQWLGDAWRAALLTTGIDGDVWHDGVETTPWGRTVCFGSLGPGEVAVGRRKVVGISQRRTREGARFQCLVYAAWEPSAVLDLLDLPQADRDRAEADLLPRAAGVGDRLAQLEEAIISELMRPATRE